MIRVPETHVPQAEAIAALFKGKLDPVEQRALHGHLAQCPPCRRVYNRYAEAERALSSSSDFPWLSQDRIEARLLGGPTPRAPRWRSAVFGSALATVAAAAMLVFVPKAPTDDELVARGQGGLSPDVSLRVLIIGKSETGDVVARDLASGAARPGERLQVLVTSADRGRQARAFLTCADGGARPISETTAIAPGQDDQTLASIEVPSNCANGRLRITAVYSTETAALDIAPNAAGDDATRSVRIIEGRLEPTP